MPPKSAKAPSTTKVLGDSTRVTKRKHAAKRPFPPIPKKHTNISSPEVDDLKSAFKITPKTASLLIQSGYTHYTSLRVSSPNRILQQFEKLPGIKSHAQAEGYRNAMRRMCWLATQERPEEKAKDCKNWSMKALKERRIWCDGFDGLTGEEMERRTKIIKEEAETIKDVIREDIK
jgi:hypothetical protein